MKAKQKNKHIGESKNTLLDITEEMTNGVNFSKYSTDKTAFFNTMQQN